ncbi:hypothetical protein PTSG_05260 [Salpingoeca rosetta]|uniref:JmjC domain-containing protein n=1 Tax=Salpingoeca rosetta (strain ATCC 50818 / BSB-021) TaxID=946362 RepID=F2U9X8_SALR5|nr:uncharacterized protein PTSG_05260 [Salpingoeca rosetta]EGD73553.1 hypothetical protein PTSG_05260 [Salpingoeca rosetta]|eukprot:XP_004993835.1 hypothetical protein PTSG_05260 [Salpingoeca rosetta]
MMMTPFRSVLMLLGVTFVAWVVGLFFTSGTASELRVSYKPDIFQQLQGMNAPVVIEGVPLHEVAPCFGWTLLSLATKLSKAVPVKYQGSSSEFLYFNEAMLLEDSNRYGSKVTRKAYKESLARLTTILDDSKWDTIEGMYRYASGPAEVMLDKQRLRDVANLSTLAVREDADAPAHINVWIGNGNTTAALHYDTSHNVYAVLAGTKTFTILPPTFIDARVRFHSSLHPLYRQAADAWRDVEAAYARDMMHVTLHPGDLLYLPPYWLHRVRSNSAWSLAVNVWSDSQEFMASEECFALPLPFDATWPRHKLMGKTALYLQELNAKLGGRNFRFHDRTKGEDGHANDRCFSWPPLPLADNALNANERQHLNTLAACLRRIKRAHVRRVYVHNFVEQTAALVAGDGVLSFLRCTLVPMLNTSP